MSYTWLTRDTINNNRNNNYYKKCLIESANKNKTFLLLPSLIFNYAWLKLMCCASARWNFLDAIMCNGRYKDHSALALVSIGIVSGNGCENVDRVDTKYYTK